MLVQSLKDGFLLVLRDTHFNFFRIGQVLEVLLSVLMDESRLDQLFKVFDLFGDLTDCNILVLEQIPGVVVDTVHTFLNEALISHHSLHDGVFGVLYDAVQFMLLLLTGWVARSNSDDVLLVLEDFIDVY